MVNFKKVVLLFFLVFILLSGVSAQNNYCTIQGIVTDEEKAPVAFANISLEKTNIGCVSGEDGRFVLKTEKTGNHNLLIRFLGYETKTIPVKLEPGKTIRINETLKADSREIGEVKILGKSNTTILREKSYAIEVIEARDFKSLSTNGFDILGKISGVNTRQSGGMGSSFSVSLNGLSDNQVRIFIDGVPMDYFGTSLSLNNFSANLIESVQVYKGVVPIHLSADALGGAINVVTNVNSGSFVDASYSHGSLNTHVASLNSRVRNKKSGFTFDLKSFYNHSDNNYKIPVYLVDFETGKESETPTWVERFHDAYTSRMVWLETGFTGTDFADILMIGAMYSDNSNEIQQPEFATGTAKIPYGEVATSEEKLILTGKYSKKDFIIPGLSLSSNGVAVFSENMGRDTSSYRYDWFGGKEFFDQDVGEIENRKTLLTLHIRNYLNNTYAEYDINNNHGIAAGFSLNYLKLNGTDKRKEQNNTQFKNPSTVAKNIWSLSYSNNAFSDKLKSSAFIKQYSYTLNSVSTNYQGNEEVPVEINKDFFGYGLATTYHFNNFQLKGSFENATRFPEIVELFGDGLNIYANPELQPEQSYNYNFGGLYNYHSRNGFHTTMLSLNLFLRDTKNYIRANAIGIKTQYINDQSVISKGVDLAVSYQYKNRLQMQMNGSFIDKRDNTYDNGNNNTYEIRIPNEPYLFGKLFLSYRFDNVLKQGNVVALNATQHYVLGFPYQWENLASEDKAEIPTQYPTDLEGVYSLDNGKYNLSVGIANVFDLALYDNYSQRRPGRTYSFKFRIFIQ